MTLVNGPTSPTRSPIRATRSPSSWPPQPDDAKVVDEMFLRILSRPATPAEIEAGVAALHADGRRSSSQLQGRVGRLRKPSSTPSKPSGKRQQAAPDLDRARARRTEVEHERHLRQAARSLGAGRRARTARARTRSTLTHRAGRHHGDSAGSYWPMPKLPGGGPAARRTATSCSPSSTSRPRPRPIRPRPSRCEFGRAPADFSQDGLPGDQRHRRQSRHRLGDRPQVGKNHTACSRSRTTSTFAGGTLLTLRSISSSTRQHTIGKFRVAVTSASGRCNLRTVRRQHRRDSGRAARAAQRPQQKAELAELTTVRWIADWVRLSNAGARDRRASEERAADRRAGSGLGTDQQPGVLVQSISGGLIADWAD